MTEASDPTGFMTSPTPPTPSTDAPEATGQAISERAMLVRWAVVGALILVGVLLYVVLGTSLPSLVEWRTT